MDSTVAEPARRAGSAPFGASLLPAKSCLETHADAFHLSLATSNRRGNQKLENGKLKLEIRNWSEPTPCGHRGRVIFKVGA